MDMFLSPTSVSYNFWPICFSPHRFVFLLLAAIYLLLFCPIEVVFYYFVLSHVYLFYQTGRNLILTFWKPISNICLSRVLVLFWLDKTISEKKKSNKLIIFDVLTKKRSTNSLYNIIYIHEMCRCLIMFRVVRDYELCMGVTHVVKEIYRTGITWKTGPGYKLLLDSTILK